jgi:hypothetical protein
MRERERKILHLDGIYTSINCGTNCVFRRGPVLNLLAGVCVCVCVFIGGLRFLIAGVDRTITYDAGDLTQHSINELPLQHRSRQFHMSQR